MKSKLTSYQALRTDKQFLKLLAANCVNRFGDSIDAIAFSWMAYEITQSASVMALMMGLNYIPTVLLQPLMGALVDRLNKRRVMVLTDIGRGLVVLTFVLLLRGGALTTGLLIAGTMLNSLLECFRMPASSAIVPKLLPEEHYTLGVAFNSSVCRVFELVGLELAGGVVAAVGVSGALLIDMGTFVISAVIIAWIRLAEARSEARIQVKTVLDDFSQGLRFTRQHKLLMVLMLLAMLINFFMVPCNVFLTPFVADDLAEGPELLSVLNILLVSGLAVGAYVTPKLKRASGKMLVLTGGVISGLAIASLFFAPGLPQGAGRYALVMGALLLLGLTIGMINVVADTTIMHIVPKEMMGRMSALIGAVCTAIMPIGSFLCSFLSGVMSVPQVLLASGLFAVLVYALMGLSKTLKGLTV